MIPTNNFEQIVYTVFWVIIYALFLTVFFTSIAYAIFSRRRNKLQQMVAYDLTFLQIKLPKENELEVKAAEHLFSSLWGIKRPFFTGLLKGQYRVSLEIVSKENGIGFYVVVPDEIVSLVEKQIHGTYPEAEIDIVNPNEIWDRGEFTSVTELKLSAHSFYPIKKYEDMKADSIGTITSAMSKVEKDEVLAIQYVAQPASDAWKNAGQHFVSGVHAKANNPKNSAHVDTGFVEAVNEKIAQPGFHVAIRIVSIAKDKATADTHIKNVATAFEQFTEVRYNRFKKRRFKKDIKIVDDFIYRRIKVREVFVPLLNIDLYRNTSVLNTVELATVFHFPNKEVQTPNIMWLGARRSEAPTELPETGTYLGKSIFRGVEKKIYISPEDRARHFYVVGQTGTGKTKLMTFMALQDIKNGEGVAFIDPHGPDADELLEKIPKERMDDVIYFDPSDFERPMGMNLLEAKSEEEQHLLVNSFIELLYKLYDPNRQGIMGPQLERAVRNNMLTAMCDPEGTMIDVLRLLIDDEYYKKFLPMLEDPMVRRYWTDEQAKTTANRKGEMMGYFVSKFDRLVSEKIMRNMVGQPKSSFNFHDVMAKKKILIVKLAKGKIGEENSNFLGLLIVPRILAAALARTRLVEQGQEFPPFYLYVDEFQNYATPDFATILAEARKYKLNLIVGHQFIGQLDDTVKEAVFGNVGTMAVFRVGIEDAEFLETHFEPTFTKNDLANNPVGHCYMRLLVEGKPTRPFSMATDWDLIQKQNAEKSAETGAAIRELSRMRYGRPREEVEAFINKRMGEDERAEGGTLPQQGQGTKPAPTQRLPF